MKRQREEGEVDVNLAHLLMLLSTSAAEAATTAAPSGTPQPSERMFECKTCNRQFPSFQALGGHRASHKKPRLHDQTTGMDGATSYPSKPRVHECSICGLEFSLGQALGGHMRRHRAILEGGSNTHQYHSGGGIREEEAAPKVTEKIKEQEKGKNRGNGDGGSGGSGSSLELDLNAPPSDDPLLTFRLGPPIPFVFL